jgi:hypothetical protein
MLSNSDKEKCGVLVHFQCGVTPIYSTCTKETPKDINKSIFAQEDLQQGRDTQAEGVQPVPKEGSKKC